MASEQWTLGGVSFHDPANGLRIKAASVNPARRRATWLENPDADGAVLGQIPRAALREHVYRLQYSDQASMDTALGKLATVVDKIEACKLDPNGLPLVWTPHNSTKTGTFRALLGEIVELPVELGGDAYGWFRGNPVFVVSLTCLPFWEGTELGTPIDETWTTPVGTVTIPDVPGDAPALGELVVTNDEATDHVRWLMWGSGPNAGGLIDSDALVTSGFGGSGTTRTGAYDVGGGNTVIRATLISSTSAVCGTGELTHVGTYKVLARVFATEDAAHIRLAWQDKDGPWSANPWAVPPVTDDWAKVDLGTITLTSTGLGDQVWSGRIEAYNVNGGTLDVDFIVLVPVTDGHGVARAVSSAASGVVVGYDTFSGTTAGNNLNARTAPAGGTWATSGAATDFQFSDTDESGVSVETLTRSSSSGVSSRFAILGSSAMTNMQVATDFGLAADETTGDCGVIARWVDSSNYLKFTISATIISFTRLWEIRLTKVVAGSSTVLAQRYDGFVTAGPVGRLELTVYATGVAIGKWFSPTGALLETLTASDAVLFTGGTLDDGTPGLIDAGNGTTVTRHYANYSVLTPPPEPIVIYAGQDLRVTHDDCVRADVDSGRYGVPPSYRPAGHFYVQPEGSASRSTHLVVVGSPTDLDTAPWSTIDHSLTAEVTYTPRGNAIPR